MPKRNFSEQEKKIIKFWKENKIFEKSVERTPKNGDYVFYDGPPFATGLPHYGHLVGSCLKDVVPRYWTMKGYRVERVWGWDCHGLPIENIVEKELGLKSKKDIEELGVEKFNEKCRSKVLLYAEEWKKVITRLGRFVDMDNAYKTMDKDYMESIWWVFKELWDKGLIYESYKSMHICPRCETTLSQSEVSQGYMDVKDISVTAKFELADEPGTYILSWTTTPWTLAGNVALAVNPDIEYIKVKIFDEKEEKNINVIISKDIWERDKRAEMFRFYKEGEILDTFLGSSLVGKKYIPIFSYFVNDKTIKNIENGFVVVPGKLEGDDESFVNTEEGTGVVHIAPAFGEDDMKTGEQYNLPFIQHVGMDGRFIDKVTDFAGQEVKPKDNTSAADIEVLKYLAQKNLVYAKEKYEHSYPHCWRCDSPLLNYATSSWFVGVTQVKDRMIKLAEQINWIPEHLKDGRFGKWLSGARDWSISRQRFWGSVLPIWKCPSCGEIKVFGSVAELEELSGKKVDDLHKDVVDNVQFPCPKCPGKMKRIPDVLDCWFESGSMPYAQMHYPFENKEKFENNYPAQFIAEGVDQTRCWFYYMQVLSTAIMDDIAFKNVIANGIVLAEDGKKMSKKLQNYPDPMEIMEKYGADAMRLYLMSSPVVKADDFCFAEKGVDDLFKKVMMIYYNVFSFYEMYKQEDLLKMDVPFDDVLDIWILARLQVFIKEVTDNMDAYDLMKASKLFVDFINDLSTWYIRRSRDRFKLAPKEKRAAALQVLNNVLIESSKVMAPFIPFLTEDIYRECKKEKDPESVHLCEWPLVKNELADEKLLKNMETLRKIVELGLSLRAEKGIKIRQPLQQLSYTGSDLGNEMSEILKDELNVKNIKFVTELPVSEGCVIKEDFGIKAALNIVMTKELELEGLVRELVRNINLMRKDLGFTINDTARLIYNSSDDDIKETLKNYSEDIKQSTKTSAIEFDANLEDAKIFNVNGKEVKISLEK